MEKERYQTKTVQETFNRLFTSIQGLGDLEVKKRRVLYGKNVLNEETISGWGLFFRQFHSVLVYILILASLLSVFIGEWIDCVVINCIILINGLIGFWQEWKAEHALAALKKLTESRCKVFRAGKLEWIQSSEIVPGDIVIVHEGEIVTADVRLVESSGLMVDESSITGESIPAEKDHAVVLDDRAQPYEWKNMLLSGTLIARGSGKGVVVGTGRNTYLASIAEKMQEASPETPLTKALAFFTKRYVMLLLGLFLVLGVIGYSQGRSPMDLSYLFLASLVSAVPEGLPIVVTLVMVFGALALSKRRALIRYLPSVETLGSATVIASDKTGTITEGHLSVKEVYAPRLEEVRKIAALCNDAHQGVGDPLDVALAHWVNEGYEALRQRFPRCGVYSFDTRLRMMAVVHPGEKGEELSVKGAYESLKQQAENKEDFPAFEEALDLLLKRGLRVLALGKGTGHIGNPRSWRLTLEGLVGFLDPPKEGVKKAVEEAKKAGVRVLMITGDHPLTAQAVAMEVGISSPFQPVLSGQELDHLSDTHLLQSLAHVTVFARILPEHKYRIIKLLQEAKAIVAVTGDGVNDVPALKAADIGIAMGSGTEAAKSVASMIIADNDLNIITEAIRNARVIADNIRKVIYYLVSTSVQEITLIALSILSALPSPLVAIQILWVNIVTDGVQDKTFPFATAETDVMKRKPRLPQAQFFDARQVGNIAFFGIVMGVVSFFLYRHLLHLYDVQTASTLMFTSLVVSQWANGIQAQKEKEPFFKNIVKSITINPCIFLGVVVGVLLQGTALYVFPSVFHVVRLSWGQWIYPLGAFVLAFGLVELRKWAEHFFLKRLG